MRENRQPIIHGQTHRAFPSNVIAGNFRRLRYRRNTSNDPSNRNESRVQSHQRMAGRVARTGRDGVFQCGLRASPIRAAGIRHRGLRHLPRATRAAADYAVMFLHRVGDRLRVLRTATRILLEYLWRGGHRAVAGAGVVDRAVRGAHASGHRDAWIETRRVPHAILLDGTRILPQRTLLPEILVAERGVCVRGVVGCALDASGSIWDWVSNRYFRRMRPGYSPRTLPSS